MDLPEREIEISLSRDFDERARRALRSLDWSSHLRAFIWRLREDPTHLSVHLQGNAWLHPLESVPEVILYFNWFPDEPRVELTDIRRLDVAP